MMDPEIQKHRIDMYDDWGRDLGLKKRGLIQKPIGFDPTENNERAMLALEQNTYAVH